MSCSGRFGAAAGRDGGRLPDRTSRTTPVLRSPEPGMSACALLDLGKCLGPCIGAVDAASYRAAVERAAGLLQGQDDVAADRVDGAARRPGGGLALRGGGRPARPHPQVEHVIGVQRRLDSVATRNLAIIAPSVAPAPASCSAFAGGSLWARRRSRQTRADHDRASAGARLPPGSSRAAHRARSRSPATR